MANTYTVAGDSNIAFGTADVGFTDVGEILSATHKKTGEKLELKNTKGNTFAVVYFDNKEEVEIDAIWDIDFELPERGDQITILGIATLLVDDVELKYSNDKDAQINIRTTAYAAMTIS